MNKLFEALRDGVSDKQDKPKDAKQESVFSQAKTTTIPASGPSNMDMGKAAAFFRELMRP